MGQRAPAEPAERRGSSARRPAIRPCVLRELIRTRASARRRSSLRRRRCSPSRDRAGRDGPRSAARRARNGARATSRRDPVERHGRTALRASPRRSRSAIVSRLGRQGEAGLVDQPVEQVGRRASMSASGGAWARISASMSRELRPRLEQAVEIDAARQPLDDVAQAVERALRIGARRDRPQQRGQHRLERRPRRRRAQRSRLARAPVGDALQRDASDRRSRARQARRARMSGSFDSRPSRSGRKPVEQRSGRFDVRLRAARSARRRCPGREASRHRRARRRSSGKRWVCASSTICTRCSIVRSSR